MTPEARQLRAGLRELRDSAGLSLARLADRTGYSKSSWARYLKGGQPVPYDAVVALCRVAGERPERLLALWELADAEWSGRGKGRDEGARTAEERERTAEERERTAEERERTAEERERTAPGHGRVLLVAAGGCLVAALCVAVLLVPGERAEQAAMPPATYAPPATYSPGCTGATCDGRDPADMGCGGQSMVTSAAERTLAGGQRVELRYGEVCRAVWARASRLRVGDRVEVSRPGAPPRNVRAADKDDTEGYLATPMTAADDGPSGARVCLVPADGERVCFGA
ncbi:helix-turn-helix domain-containing protein [Streptomyces albicerus]|uniref:helix-turn-helix domain-containing protein n=1 Tax=Streptomyces albicerus TaxID=2569859 RepID=UPI001CEDD32B|nr:helix-turn-helix domain-containing protein [Streptomyces albicerus]